MSKANINIFNDTLDFIKENKVLSDGVNYSIKKTRVVDKLIDNIEKTVKKGIVTISTSRTFQAAMLLKKKYPDKRIGVLNFASATNPGGGVEFGSSAQEESLCRCSTLYPVISHELFFSCYYLRNRMINNPLHSDTVIYSPDIIICKTDTDNPVRLKEEDFVKVDVLSCAAPNLRDIPSNKYNYRDGDNKACISDDELFDLHVKRGKAILDVALFNHIDVLVLGAFGCGAFRNDPRVVAKAYKELLKEYSKYFTEIEFAIYCNQYDLENYQVFKSIFFK